MRPESRTTTGIEASMMTSLGTCRLVMPRAESTMARAGREAYCAAMSALICALSSGGRSAMASSREPRPLRGFTPSRAKVCSCFAKTSAKNTDTASPNITGSETFIIVALRCSDSSRPSDFAAAICSA